MAKIGIFDEQKQQWVQIDEDTEVLVRFVDKEELNALNRKADKTARLTKGDVSVIGNRLLGEVAVFGWRKITDHSHPGLLDANGNPIPFTTQNRDMLMKRCREFSNFVNETAIDSSVYLEMQSDNERNQENRAEIKNS